MLTKTSQISRIYQKLLYYKNLYPINIGYTYSNTLFDNTIKYACTDNSRFIEYDANSIMPYNLVCINNPIEFSSKDNEDSTENRILFFHDPSILTMKKEDLYLFNEKTDKHKKYSFNKDVSDIFSNVNYISYGFPFKVKNNIPRTKNILLLGNGQNIESIMNHEIKNKFSETDLISIKNIHNTNIDISSILEDYKICICMNSEYNKLLSAANGCFVISFDNDNIIPHYTKASNLDDIINRCSYILTNYSSMQQHHLEIAKTICNKYEYTNFTKTLSSIIENSLL